MILGNWNGHPSIDVFDVLQGGGRTEKSPPDWWVNPLESRGYTRYEDRIQLEGEEPRMVEKPYLPLLLLLAS